MPDDPGAEDDYRSFCEALSSTARGRAFLEEFSRRNRHADTETVLNALARLEATALSHASTSPEADRIRQDLRALLDTLRRARPQTENSPTAIKAATLAALIDFTQARIESLVVMPGEASESEPLAAVPSLDQPELPIPHPAAASMPVMALVPPSPAATHAFGSAARRKTATVVPVVEFDYRTQQAGRPAPVRSGPEEDWSALAPPVIASPTYPASLPSSPAITESAATSSPAPKAPLPAGTDAEPEATNEAAATVEPYELWLDPPAVAAAEPETSAEAALETPAVTVDLAVADIVTPWPQADWNIMRNDAVFETAAAIEASVDATSAETHIADTLLTEATIVETAIVETEIVETTFVQTTVVQAAFDEAVTEAPMMEAAVTEAPMAAQASGHDAGTAMTTIETLMQQMEKTAAAAPAIRGHAEGADPLAPIMALSEEERIALFT